MDNYSTSNNMSQTPYIRIIEQPTSKFRYRYDSEQGSHGKLMANSHSKTNKCFPKIQVLNCYGRVKIIASLYVIHDGNPIRHVHKLHGKHCNSEGVFEIEKDITMHDTEIELNDVSIGHVAKKNIVEILTKRCIKGIQDSKTTLAREGFIEPSDLSDIDVENARKKAKELEAILNKKLNEVVICFEAFTYIDHVGGYVKLCEPEYSEAVLNRKSTSTGELKISRLSKCAGTVRGGEEVIILCEKIDKKNIKVRFFEMQNGEETWEAEGIFSEVDVHHQYAIVMKTPPYKKLDIEDNVLVYMQLLRPSDETTSECREYTYIADREYDMRCKKRKMNFVASGEDFHNSNYAPGTFRVAENTNTTSTGLKLEMPSSSNDSSGASCSMAAGLQAPTTADILDEYCLPPLPQSQVASEPNLSQTISYVEHPFPHDVTLSQLNIGETTETQFPSTYHQTVGNSIFVPADQSSQPVLTPSILHLEESDFEFPDLDFDGVLNSRGDDVIFSDSPDKLQTDSKNMSADKSNSKLYWLAINTAKALHNYARSGDTKRLLIPMRSLITYADENGDNSVHVAVIHSKPEALEYMLSVYLSDSRGFDMDVVNHCNNLLQTPLHIAVHNDDAEIVRLLMKFGANPNQRDRHGNSAFHIAADHQHDKIMNILLKDTSRKLELVNNDGYTALHLAIMADSLSCTQILCKNNADIDARAGTNGETPLHMSVKNMNIEIVKYLLKEKADVDVQMFNGCTALHLAVVNDSEDIVLALIRAHADPYLENNERFLNESSDEEKLGNDPESLSLSETGSENRYCNSFDLAKDNEKIRQLLDGIGLGYDVDYELEYSPKPLSITEKSRSNLDSGIGSGTSSEIDPIALDIDIKRSLARLFDPPGEKDWKMLSQCLDLDDMISKIEEEKVESPTCALLGYVPTMNKLHYALEAMDCKEALSLLENYRAKNEGTSVYKTKGNSIADILLPMSKMNLRS